MHLQPHFGTKRLDAITTEQVQRLKHALTNRAPKTVNNVLTVLNVVLRKAAEWNVLGQMRSQKGRRANSRPEPDLR